jgi:coiled-coil domain-containing protein 55
VSAIFSREGDEDDNGTETNAIQKANREIFSRPTTNLDSEQLNDIYDYDGQYESFKQDREKEILSYQQTTITNPSSRYIDSLKAAAKVREKEKDRRFERKLLKERNEEDGEFGDKPKFITSAYKHKLQEDKQWEYEDR